jgi:uncharacterized protein DUF6680
MLVTSLYSFLVAVSVDPTAPAAASEPATHFGLRASEWIMIAAILVGPILAVITQFIWQHRKQKHDAKIWVFSTLMSLRGSPLNPDFIKAANSIDVVFYKNQKIRGRWKAILEHLTSDAYKPENFTPQAFERFRDLLAELLSDMAKDVGYRYDFTHFKENAWAPRWYGVAEEENLKLRQGLIAALEDKGSLSVKIKPDQPVAAVARPQNPNPPRE